MFEHCLLVPKAERNLRCPERRHRRRRFLFLQL